MPRNTHVLQLARVFMLSVNLRVLSFQGLRHSIEDEHEQIYNHVAIRVKLF
ncbi:hypothetical protein GJV44_00349 [Candidatus Vallotia cooleyia]|nr:hypothetical protein GJV44_00349 [Candidatus Vallotia cooleyia]